MTSVEYINKIILQYKSETGENSYSYKIANQVFYPLIKDWFKEDLRNVEFSGSYAKGTGIKGDSDLDLFISLNHSANFSLGEMYWNLFNFLKIKGYSSIQQNVSIGLNYDNIHVDLIPSIQQNVNSNYHSLYKSKENTWIQTNIYEHIKLIKNSNKINEILFTKIWKKLNNLTFPSFYLELSVLQALEQSNANLETNIIKILQYLSTNFLQTRIIDPSNSNNIISDDLSDIEKQKISEFASNSLQQKYWRDIIW